MKLRYNTLLKPALLLSALACCGLANAATIYVGDPDDEGSPYTAETSADGLGITYSWVVTIGAGESISTPNDPNASVGVWSWEDASFAGASGMGWTHTTSWVALEVTEATQFTLTLAQNAGIPMAGGFRATDNLFPSFTIWSGWDNSGEDNHTYSNRSTIDWAEGLTSVVGYVQNSTEHSVTATYTLEAGLYTIALGSNGPEVGGLPRQGFTATFDTVPEPGAISLAGLALAGFVIRRRRN